MNYTMNTLASHDYDTRVAKGKEKEAIILATLKNNGVKITPPTASQDMHDKIDGWVMNGGTRKGIQIKFRERGKNDIIFEIVKDIAHDITGRDLRSKADLYLVVDSTGTGRMYDAAEIKRHAQGVRLAVMASIGKSDKRSWTLRVGAKVIGEAKLTIDQAHGNFKLMAYFLPDAFPVLDSWKFNLGGT
jgi:hypothetical protein